MPQWCVRFEGYWTSARGRHGHYPVTALNGSAHVPAARSTAVHLVGSTDLALARSRIDSLQVHDGARWQLRFADGRMTIFGEDTVETVAGRVIASGGLGLGGNVRDSLALAFTIDSLGGLRQFLRAARTDSLAGSIEGNLVLRGSIDTLDVSGIMNGADIVMPGLRAHHIRPDADADECSKSVGGDDDVTRIPSVCPAAGLPVDGDSALAGRTDRTPCSPPS